jgi:hypothetical protein
MEVVLAVLLSIITWGIYLVAAFFVIVLLYKLWVMCNDVSRIKKQLVKNYDIETSIEFLLRIGEKEKAKELLLNRILTNESIFNREAEMTQDEKIEHVFRVYEEELKKLGYDVPASTQGKTPTAD